MNDKARLEGLERSVSGMLTQRRLDRNRITELEKGQAQLQQAILEVSRTRRKSK